MFVRSMLATPFLALFLASPVVAQAATAKNEAPQRTELAKPIVSVPMDNWGGRPVVQARINGRGPFKLLLDTGTGFAAVLDDDLLKKLELPVPDKAPTPGSIGENDPVGVDTITIGDAEFSKVKVRPTDFGGFMPPGREGPEGILGLPLFEHCLLTLDYPGNRVILESGELAPPNGEIIVYSPDRERDFGVTIGLSVAGVNVRAHLDSGSPGFVTLLNKMQEKLPLTGKPQVIGLARTPQGETEIRLATLDGVVKIGPHEFTNPKINFADLGPMVDHDCGNVGYRLLKDFTITLDQKNRRIRLRRAGAAEE